MRRTRLMRRAYACEAAFPSDVTDLSHSRLDLVTAARTRPSAGTRSLVSDGTRRTWPLPGAEQAASAHADLAGAGQRNRSRADTPTRDLAGARHETARERTGLRGTWPVPGTEQVATAHAPRGPGRCQARNRSRADTPTRTWPVPGPEQVASAHAYAGPGRCQARNRSPPHTPTRGDLAGARHETGRERTGLRRTWPVPGTEQVASAHAYADLLARHGTVASDTPTPTWPVPGTGRGWRRPPRGAMSVRRTGRPVLGARHQPGR